MTDLFTRDAAIVVPAAAIALLILPLQLMLCFRAKKRFVKLLPAGLFTAAALISYVMAITAKDWSAFAYLIAAFVFVVLLVSDGTAWCICGAVRAFKNKKCGTDVC